MVRLLQQYENFLGRQVFSTIMGTGSRRNESCECGSGKKQKYCHPEGLKYLGQRDGVIKHFFLEKRCYAPKSWHKSCNSTIVNAHTISKSLGLAEIAQEGHVYTYDISVSGLERGFSPVMRGVNNASTFLGFCSYHDDVIFAPLEKSCKLVPTKEQCFLLAYRAFCDSLYGMERKIQTVQYSNKYIKHKSPWVAGVIEAYLKNMPISLEEGKRIKERFDASMLRGDFEMLQSYVIVLDRIPPVLCSSNITPEFDFSGDRVQNFGYSVEKIFVQINILGKDGKGYVIISWLASQDSEARKFAESLDSVPNNKLSAAVLRLMFGLAGNICMSPTWWEGLSDCQRETLNDFLFEALKPDRIVTSGLLEEMDIRDDPWGVVDRRWI